MKSVEKQHFLCLMLHGLFFFLLYLQRQNSTESPTGLEEGLMTFTYKGVPLRFGFDCVWTSQLQTKCQEQSNGNAPNRCVVFLHWLPGHILVSCVNGVNHTSAWGLSALLVSTFRAMRRPIHRERVTRNWLHAWTSMYFVSVCKSKETLRHQA